MFKNVTGIRFFVSKPSTLAVIMVSAAVLALFANMAVAFATDENEDGGSENTPRLQTVAGLADALDEEENWRYAGEESPAFGSVYTEEQINEDVLARVKGEEQALEKAAAEAAAKEAGELASELVKNGKYKDLIGYENRYEKYWDPEEDPDGEEEGDEDAVTEDEDEEIVYDGEDQDADSDPGDEDEDLSEDDADFEEEAENVHDRGPYYGGLADRYPHLDAFWFDKDGKYHYEYSADLDGIDYSGLYTYIEHDTFLVKDRVEYRDLKPGMKYTAAARLVRLQTAYADQGEAPANGAEAEENDPDAEAEEPTDGTGVEAPAETYEIESEIKSLSTPFVADESGSGSFEIDFGKLQLIPGRYVFLLKVTTEDGAEIIDHDDLGNISETILIDRILSENEKAVAAGGDPGSGAGQVTFPSGKKEKKDPGPEDHSPATGDPFLPVLLVLAMAGAAGLSRKVMM